MKYLISILAIFIMGNLFSQGDLVIKSKVSENEIILRWTPTVADLFLSASKNGYSIKRKEWTGNGNLPMDFWESGVDFEKKIFVPDKNDSILKRTMKVNPDVAILFSFLHSEGNSTKMEKENSFGLSLLACDLNPDIAEIAGLIFKDNEITIGKTYAYKVEILSLKKSKVILIDSDKKTKLPVISDFELKPVNGSAEISWNFIQNQEYYSGYFIERSEDEVNFKKVNDRPFIPMFSQFEKDKQITFYQDIDVEEGKTYWYRIQGKDHFGGLGEYSPVKKIFIFPIFKGEIIIDTLYEVKNNEAVLEWHLSDKNDELNVQKIKLLHSQKINGTYELYKEISVSEKDISLSLKNRENYFKLMVENESSKLESWPSLLLIPDRIPPAVPDSLTGKIDRDGKVILSWKNNQEKDLMAYRVFWCNSLNEEMKEARQDFILKNIFEDSVDINNLNEEIFFSVNAVDSFYNNSALSIPVKLQKPDFIAPVVAPIVKIVPMVNGNRIVWNSSASSDVVKTELRRSKDAKYFECIGFSKDTSNTYLDTLVKSGEGYYYRTVVIDDANNFSESEMMYLINDIVKNTFNDSVIVSVDRKEKFIHLKWKSLKEEVYSYVIYKAKKGDVLRSFKTVNANVNELKDQELYISNEYIYAIKAILKSGREVIVKSEINVQY